MSNWGLQAEVNSLSAELRRIEAVNAELQAELNACLVCITGNTARLEKNKNNVVSTIENSIATITSSNNLSIKAYETEIFIEKLYRKYKNVEKANKNLRELNNKKIYEYKDFRKIRKIVEAMLTNFELGLVSKDVIYKMIERQQILMDKYWLTPCLISIMAWNENNKKLANDSIKKAIEIDKKSSCIFYILFNLKFARVDAATKWLKLYGTCDIKGEDEKDILMLLSLLSDSNNIKEYDIIREEVKNLLLKLTDNSKELFANNLRNNIINILRKYKKSFIDENSNFPKMKECINDYENINQTLYLSYNNIKILEVLHSIIDIAEKSRSKLYDVYINELVNYPSIEEKSIYQEINYQELIIKLKGDVDKANDLFLLEKNKNESAYNIIQNANEKIFDFSNKDISNQMRNNMFGIVQAYQKEACNLYFDMYRSMKKEKYNVKINEYETVIDFTDKVNEYKKVDEYYKKLEEDELSKINNTSIIISFLTAIIPIGLAIYYKNYMFLYWIIASVILGILVIFEKNYKKEEIKKSIVAKKESVLKNIDILFDEYNVYEKKFSKYDDVSKEILETFDNNKHIANIVIDENINSNIAISINDLYNDIYETKEEVIEKKKNEYANNENIAFGDTKIEESEVQKIKEEKEKIVNSTDGINEKTITSSEKEKNNNSAVIIGFVLLIIFGIYIFSKGDSNNSYKSERNYQNNTTKNTSVNGNTKNGWLQENNEWVYYKNNVKLNNQWISENGYYYYLNNDGYMSRNDWIMTDNKWYHVGNDGIMQKNVFLEYDKNYCYVQNDGSMVKNNWMIINNYWYYFDNNGYAKKNAWQDDCYLGSDGKMLVNTITPDGYKVGADGKYIPNIDTNVANNNLQETVSQNAIVDNALSNNIIQETSVNIITENIIDTNYQSHVYSIGSEKNYERGVVAIKIPILVDEKNNKFEMFNNKLNGILEDILGELQEDVDMCDYKYIQCDKCNIAINDMYGIKVECSGRYKENDGGRNKIIVAISFDYATNEMSYEVDYRGGK